MSGRTLIRSAALIGYFGLIALLLVWQLWLSPPQLPTAFVLLVLVGPLLPVLRGMVQGRAKSHFWASILALFYCVHGIGEAYAVPQERLLGAVEILLSIDLYAAGLLYVRLCGGVIPRRGKDDEVS